MARLLPLGLICDTRQASHGELTETILLEPEGQREPRRGRVCSLASREDYPREGPRALLLCLALLALEGCPGGRPETGIDSVMPPRLGLQETLLQLPGSRWHLRSSEVTSEIVSNHLFLDRDYELEFLPLNHGVGDPRLEIFVSEASSATALGVVDPVDGDSLSPDGRGVLDALKHLSRVPLEGFAGHEVRIGFRLSGDRAGSRVSIGMPRLLRPRSPRPDILLICSDTHRFDYSVGAGELMPNLRRLEEQAVVYTRVLSTATWTLPAVTSLLTGLDTDRHATGRRLASYPRDDFDAKSVKRGQFVVSFGDRSRVLSTYPSQLQTLPEILRRYQYTSVVLASNPLYRLSGLVLDGTDLVVETGVAKGSALAELAEGILAAVPRDRPLFLLVHLMDAHQWPTDYSNLFPDETERSRDRVVYSYEEAVRRVDHAVGSLLDHWSQRRDYENSLIVFTSDHGEHLLDADDPTIAITGHGNTMDDVLLHIPLIVKLPASSGVPLKAGSSDSEASIMDLVPTILVALRIPFDRGSFSGHALQLGGSKQPDSRLFFADFQLYGEDLASVRWGRFKLIKNFDRETHSFLYLPVDGSIEEPGLGTTSQQGREIEGKLLEELRLHRRRAEEEAQRLSGFHATSEVDALRQLRALGYVD